MRDLYKQVGGNLDKVGFDRLWPGFAPIPFALYNQRTVYLKEGEIPWDERFLGNTAIEYEGNSLAIWQVENLEGTDPERLAAGLAHEMFHGFQRSCGEKRYPNELEGLDIPILLENYQIKHQENQLLAAACEEGAPERKRGLLRQFAALRRAREGLPGNTLEFEYQAETIEGTAEYIGLGALWQMNPAKFTESMRDYAFKLRSLKEDFFEPRKTAYYSGAMLLLAAGQLGLPFHHDLGREEKTLFELLLPELGELPEAGWEVEPVVEQRLNAWQKRRKEAFLVFFASKRQKTEGSFVLCGYDPMNMIKRGNEILCSHFVMLFNEHTGEREFVKGPVLVETDEQEPERIVRYYR